MQSNYLGLLSGIKDSDSKCGFCGSQVFLTAKNEGVCNFCEAYIPSETPAKYKPALSEIQKLIDLGKIEDAKAKADAIISGNMDPSLLYGAANIYSFISDFKYYDLNYSRKGFMEENSANIYYSLDMTSKSKEMFYKAIKTTLGTEGSLNSTQSLYLLSMSNLKLKNSIEAIKYISMMKEDPSLPKEYSRMVYSIETKNKEAYERIASLISKGNANAIYYLAKYYVNNKKLEEAKLILEKFNEKVRMPMSVFLLEKINRLLEEIAL